MTLTRTSAKGYFLTGSKPTQAQFAELFEGIVFQQGASAQFVESNVSAQGNWDFNKDVSVSGKVSAGSLNVAGVISASSINLTGAVSAASGHFVGIVSAATLNVTGDVQAATGKVTASALTVTGLTTLASAIGQTQPSGDSSTALATTAFCNPESSAANTGYVKFPSGHILQWGRQGGSGTSQVVTFPKPFAVACYVVTGIYNSTGTPVSSFAVDANSVSAAAFTAYTTNNFGFFWQAIGK